MTCQKWSIVQLYCHLKNNPDKYELIIEDDDRAKGLQEYAIFKVLDWQERFILEAIFMARNYNDLYPYLDDVAKKICELSDVINSFAVDIEFTSISMYSPLLSKPTPSGAANDIIW